MQKFVILAPAGWKLLTPNGELHRGGIETEGGELIDYVEDLIGWIIYTEESEPILRIPLGVHSPMNGEDWGRGVLVVSPEKDVYTSSRTYLGPKIRKAIAEYKVFELIRALQGKKD